MKAATQQTAVSIQDLELDRIMPSLTNPRKNFDEDRLDELAASIKEKGVLQPILVRPVGGDVYELVAGERRFRASKVAGLETIPAIVRDLDDRAALECQVIENLQRENLSALEEAEGYRALVDEHEYTVEQLAERLHKSKAYVYGRLKLTDLPVPAKEGLAEGDLPTSTAELIGRIPSAELREKAVGALYSQYSGWQSYRSTKQIIERDFMVELKGAPFSRKDGRLLLDAPACDACPKMTGNNRDLYPDGRADVCTDPGCFKRKAEAHQNIALEKAKAAGFAVLTRKQSEPLFSWHGGDLNVWGDGAHWVELDDNCPEDSKGRTYKQLVGDEITPTAALDRQGKIHYLIPKAEVAKILKEQHKISIATPPKSPSAAGGVQIMEQQKKEKELRRRVAEIALREIREQLAGLGPLVGAEEWAGHLRALMGDLTEAFDSGSDLMLKCRGIEDDDAGEAFNTLFDVDNATVSDQIALLVECNAADALWRWAEWGGESALIPIKEIGIDLKAIERQVKQELKQQAAAEKKSAKKKAA